MSLKKELLQLNDIKKEIEGLEDRIDKLKGKGLVSDSVTGSSHTFPYQKRLFVIKGVDLKIQEKYDKLNRLLLNRYDKLLDQQIKLEEFINKIPNSRLRRIFEYRYLYQYSWTKIAHLIGGSATIDSIKQEHYRYLEKV